MDWESLRHFAALAEHGTLTGAARSLRVEHATVARRIAALEEELGLRLVDRRSRRWRLTPEGERIAAGALDMRSRADSLRRLADAARGDVSGPVTISMPPALGAALLAGPLALLRRIHPALDIRMIGEIRSASLAQREADIAIRLSRPDSGDFAIRKLGEMAFRLYATADYLARVDPADREFVGLGGDMAAAPQQLWLDELRRGRPVAVTANTIELQHAAARAGAGIACLPDFMAAGDPGLAPVDAAGPVLRRDIWLVVHNDLREAPAIRAVIEACHRAIAGDVP